MQKILFISLCAIALQAQANNLNQLINTKAKKTVAALNQESQRQSHDSDDDSAYRYSLNAKTIKTADLNRDGIKDKVVILDYCEKTSCHSTTKSSEVVVYIGNQSGNYRFADAKSFDIGAEVAAIKSNGSIQLNIYGFGPNDPGCCPSVQGRRSYVLKNGKLVRS